MIDAVATKVPLARRCKLMQVTRSSHYRWLRRRDRVREQTGLERKLLMWMRYLHDRWHGLLGYRRMHAMLETEGFDAPLRLVRRLMKDNEMSGLTSGSAELLRRDQARHSTCRSRRRQGRRQGDDRRLHREPAQSAETASDPAASAQTNSPLGSRRHWRRALRAPHIVTKIR